MSLDGKTIPSGWAVSELSDIVDVLDGQRVPINAKERARRLGSIPYFGATGQVGWIDDWLFDEPLVLLGEDGAPFFDKTRQVAYVVSGKSWVNNHAHVLRPAQDVHCSLLRHQLNVVDYQDFVSGTTRWKLSQAPMRRIPLRIAPVGEQERIADTLDELFSDLDAAVAALERVRAKLKLYRASVLKAAVEGELTKDWRAQHPDAEPATQLLQRILAERRRRWEEDQLAKFKAKGIAPPTAWKAKYRDPLEPTRSPPSALPSAWTWTTLGQCFAVHVGATPSRSVERYWNGTIPWVASGEVQFRSIYETRERITAEGLANASTKLNPVGSVMLSMIGEGKTRGQAGILRIAACNNQNCAAIWVSETPVSSIYVYLWLLYQYQQTRELGSGNNQPAMNKTVVETIPLPLPPLAEQEAIVELVEDQLSVIDHLEADLDAKLKSAQALRQAILRRAFAGKLVPQDPNDEPAAELLKRIAAERAGSARVRPAIKRRGAKAKAA